MLDHTLNLTIKDQHNAQLVQQYYFQVISPQTQICKFDHMKQYFHANSPVLVSVVDDDFDVDVESPQMTGRTRSKTSGNRQATIIKNNYCRVAEQYDLAIKPKGLLKNGMKESQISKKVSFFIPSNNTYDCRQIVQQAINKYKVRKGV